MFTGLGRRDRVIRPRTGGTTAVSSVFGRPASATTKRGRDGARPSRRTRAFTLLEITLAVAILGLMAVAIYRFVATNLIAVRVSSEVSAEDARYAGLVNLLTSQLQNLPPGQGTLGGEPFKFGGKSRDEMTWICSAGPGLFTRYASGDYAVTMRLKPIPKTDFMELGVNRAPDNDDSTEATDVTTVKPTDNNKGTWVPLIENLRSMEIRYFDPRLNAWVDRWTDRGTLPHLVRLTLSRAGGSVPWEAVIPLRRTPL
ncbi:MAG: prepilin-type N-terminal cleavage/methylation domain-containing protein [Chthoniobacterales bacterium]